MTATVIRGDLICTEAHFDNPPLDKASGDIELRYALQGDGLQIGGNAFLRNGFRSTGVTRLIGATIGGDLDFQGAQLCNSGETTLDADRIVIGRDAYFTEEFKTDGIVWLPAATIEGSLSFAKAKFIGADSNGVNLETATIKRTLTWRGIQKTPQTELRLIDATVGRFLDDKNSWPEAGMLLIVGFKYKVIEIEEEEIPSDQHRREWLRLQADDTNDMQPYEQLAAVLRASGREAEARKVAVDREDRRHRWCGIKDSWRWFKGLVLKVTIGYGYFPRRVLYWASAVVLLGWLTFSAGYDRSLFSPVAGGVYRDEEYLSTQTLPDGYQTFSPFIYSVDTFLPIINLDQESSWLPNPTRTCVIASQTLPCGAYLRVYLWLHTIVGWALTTLAVIGFTGIVRKD